MTDKPRRKDAARRLQGAERKDQTNPKPRARRRGRSANPDALENRRLDLAVRIGAFIDALPDTRLDRHGAGLVLHLPLCLWSPPSHPIYPRPPFPISQFPIPQFSMPFLPCSPAYLPMAKGHTSIVRSMPRNPRSIPSPARTVLCQGATAAR